MIVWIIVVSFIISPIFNSDFINLGLLSLSVVSLDKGLSILSVKRTNTLLYWSQVLYFNCISLTSAQIFISSTDFGSVPLWAWDATLDYLFAPFFVEELRVLYFLLSTAYTISHRFCYIEFPFLILRIL